MTEPKKSSEAAPNAPLRKVLIFAIIPILIVAGGFLAARVLIHTAPEPRTKPAIRQARLVDTEVLQRGSRTIQISAMGTVVGKNLVSLNPQVAGKIVWADEDLSVGKTLSTGTTVFKIESSDYEHTLSMRKAALEQAEANLLIEQGQQTIAREDYELTDQSLNGDDLDLVLRKPQLSQALATVSSAKAQYESALLNLSRTEIATPFEAVVVDKQASVGAIVNSNTPLATIADCSEFWVELEVPQTDLRWLMTNDGKAAEVRISDASAWGKGVFREGIVLSISGSVDATSRMATVVVSVKDPLCLLEENKNKPRLLLGSFVSAEVYGKTLENVVAIHRDYLRSNNTLWLVGPNNTLEIKPVEVLFKGSTEAIVEGSFKPGQRMVISDLSSPVEGMQLRFKGSNPGAGKPGAGKPGKPKQG